MKVIFILLLLVFARNVDTFSNEMNDMYIGRLEDFSKSGVVALHFPCKESNKFSTNCACHIKCKSAKCENAIDVCTKYKLTHKCQFVLLRGGKMNKFATLKRTPSDEERLKFSILEFSKPNSTYSSEKSRQSFNQLLANDPYARTMLTEIQNKVKVFTTITITFLLTRFFKPNNVTQYLYGICRKVYQKQCVDFKTRLST